jgi:hypothetical protein
MAGFGLLMAVAAVPGELAAEEPVDAAFELNRNMILVAKVGGVHLDVPLGPLFFRAKWAFRLIGANLKAGMLMGCFNVLINKGKEKEEVEKWRFSVKMEWAAQTGTRVYIRAFPYAHSFL